MASSPPKLRKLLQITPALYAALVLLWFYGVVNDATNAWNHMFFVAAIALFVYVLASEKV